MVVTKNLITGGNGFIGSHLSKKLLNLGQKVICLDNFSSSEKKNIDQFAANPNFDLIEQDIVNPLNIKVHKIWHLACPASPNHYQSDPIQTARTNFLGTYNMLELARKINSKILLASTSEIYGDPKEHPQKETYRGSVNTIGLRSCYEEGKRIAETLCADYQRVYGVKIRVIRIFNTYGPNMRTNDGRVISNFIVQCLNNEKITIYGNGSQSRSFCYIDDLVNGMILAMNSDYNLPMNIGNPQEFSIFDIACKIRDLINPNIEFTYKELPLDDPNRRRPSIKLAREVLGWEPKIDLEEGLIRTIQWFKKNL